MAGETDDDHRDDLARTIRAGVPGLPAGSWWLLEKATGRWTRLGPVGSLSARPTGGVVKWCAEGRRPKNRAPAPNGTRPKPSAQPTGTGRPSWLLVDDAASPPSWSLDAGPPAGTRAVDVALIDWRPAPVTIHLTDSARDEIVAHASRRGGFTEEGGALVGMLDRGEILVTDAGGPGEKSKRTATSYGPDVEADERFVRALEARLGGRTLKVGGWHSHNTGHTRPSDFDLQAIVHHLNRTHAQDGRWRDGWLEIIVTPKSRQVARPLSVGGSYYVSELRPEEFTAWFVRPDGRRYVCEQATLA